MDYARAEANARNLIQAATDARLGASRAEALLQEIDAAARRDAPSDVRRALRDDTLAKLASFRDIERTCTEQCAEFEQLKDKFHRNAADAAGLASE
jgi:hypothetical protein